MNKFEVHYEYYEFEGDIYSLKKAVVYVEGYDAVRVRAAFDRILRQRYGPVFHSVLTCRRVDIG